MTNVLLNNNFANVNQVNLVENMDVLEIDHQNCKAKISLYGGQVLSYQPSSLVDNFSDEKQSAQQDVFWLSTDAHYQQGKAIRGGIPLCWPWFGANDKATETMQSTNHGFAREVTWQVERIDANEAAVTVVLVFQGENQHILWPTAFKLRQTLVFGKSFKQNFAMTNLSNKDAQYSGALHSYFCVSNPKNITVEALTGCDFDDKLTGKRSHQSESVSCVGPIDREYHIQNSAIQNGVGQSSTMVMLDNSWQRKVEITNRGCAQWVLWNPGVKLANNMADIHDAGEQEFVCLEAANSKWQTLPAGKTITLSQEVTVSAI